MRSRRAIVALFSLIFGTSLIAAEPFEELDNYVNAAMKEWQVPGVAIAVVKDSEVVLARGYGVKRIGGTEPVDAGTLFPLASITKNFTATALALLVEEGKLQGDDHVIAPAGSIWSNATDLAKWLQACLADDKTGLLKLKTRREMQSLQMSIPVMWDRGDNIYAARFYGAGLGWTILDYRGRKICDHAGSAGTMIAIMPEEKIGVAVLTNQGWSNLAGMLMYDVFDAYLLGPNKAWDRSSKWEFWKKADPHPEVGRLQDLKKAEASRKLSTQPTRPLSNFAGRYECDLYGDLEVRHEDGKLLFTFGANKPAASTHWEHDSFYVRRPVADDPSVDWIVSFELRDGTSHALTIRRIGWHESMPQFNRVSQGNCKTNE